MKTIPQSVTFRFSTIPAALLVATGLAGLPAQAQTDDFSSGNDSAWVHYSPLAPFGAGGVYSFPNGAYRISAPPSPNEAALGPARAGAYRAEVTYSLFHASVEFAAWDPSIHQAFGLVGRASEIGLGTTDGYMLGYMPNASSQQPPFGAITIQRFDNETITAAAFSVITLDPTKTYRLDFWGDGPNLSGAVWDVNDLANPLATVNATDARFSSGYCGLLVAGVEGVPGTYGAVSFDNYVASIPEPTTLALLLAGFGLVGGVRRARPSTQA